MLGFEHPSHMVTHPSTDEAQCCLSLEISNLKMTKIHKQREERKYKEHKVASMSGDLKKILSEYCKNHVNRGFQ